MINDLTDEDVNNTSSEWGGAINQTYNKQGSVSSLFSSSIDDNEKTGSKDLSIVEEETIFYEEKLPSKENNECIRIDPDRPH